MTFQKKIGIIVEKDSSKSFDLLKEIENARLSLFNKQKKADDNTHITELNDENEGDNQL
jgi:hypothetical protein